MLFDRTRRALGATDEAEASLLEDSLSGGALSTNRALQRLLSEYVEMLQTI